MATRLGRRGKSEQRVGREWALTSAPHPSSLSCTGGLHTSRAVYPRECNMPSMMYLCYFQLSEDVDIGPESLECVVPTSTPRPIHSRCGVLECFPLLHLFMSYPGSGQSQKPVGSVGIRTFASSLSTLPNLALILEAAVTLPLDNYQNQLACPMCDNA